MADFDNTAAVARNLAVEPWAPVRTATYAIGDPAGVNGGGASSLSGVTVATGDRFMAYNTEANGPHPLVGIYVVGEASSALATDFNSTDELIAGRTVRVLEGGLAGTVWRFDTTGTIVVGSTPLMFREVAAGTATLGVSAFDDTGAVSNTIPTTVQADWSNTAAAANTIPETIQAPFDNGGVGIVILP